VLTVYKFWQSQPPVQASTGFALPLPLWILLVHYKARFQLSCPYNPFFQIRLTVEFLVDGSMKVVIVTNCYTCDDIVKHDYVYCYKYFDHLLLLLILLTASVV